MTLGDAELVLPLALIALLAAVVNGALGNGFSSMTVPVALLFTASRILNPAVVLVEVAINGAMLVASRQSVPLVWRRLLPMVAGLVPGILAGSYLVAWVNALWLKFLVFALLAPLVLLQAAGMRRPIRSERVVGLPAGAGIGMLYSVTTISGPPLALMFNNQGLVKHEFRAALAFIRVVESSLTAAAYWALGLYTARSAELLLSMAPGVVIGIPIGAVLVRKLDAEVFRRVSMSFDAWLAGFGLSWAMAELGFLPRPMTYLVWGAVAFTDCVLLYRFFQQRGAGRDARGDGVAPGAPGWGRQSSAAASPPADLLRGALP